MHLASLAASHKGLVLSASSASNSTVLILSSCPTLHGIRLTPYWWVAVGFVLITLGGVVWNIVVQRCRRESRRILPSSAAKFISPELKFDGCIGQIISLNDLKQDGSWWSVIVGGLEFAHPGGQEVKVQLSASATEVPLNTHAMFKANMDVGSQGLEEPYDLACYEIYIQRPTATMVSESNQQAETKAVPMFTRAVTDPGKKVNFLSMTNESQEIPNDQPAMKLIEEDPEEKWLLRGPLKSIQRVQVGQFAFLDFSTAARDTWSERAEAFSLFAPSFNYCLLLLLVGAAHFIYMLATPQYAYLSSQPQSEYLSTYAKEGADAAWSPLNSNGIPAHQYTVGWLGYEQLFVRVINSGWITLSTTMSFGFLRENELKPSDHARSDSHLKALAWFIKISMAPLCPFLLTHALPALFVFPWLLMCKVFLGILLALAFYISEKVKASEAAILLGMRVFIFAFLLIIQTACHYSVLMYAQPIPVPEAAWIDIIRVEYELRSTSCYVSAINDQTHTLLAFLSWC
jgi:hypothetical protein